MNSLPTRTAPSHRSPTTALELLRDPARVRYACNPFENDRWWNADARTVGADGLVVAEAFADRAAVDTYAAEVTRVVHLPMRELIAFLQGDPRMRLLLKEISRDEPWDEPTGRTRPIVIPSVVRRCISNLLADVLEATCDQLLPPCAVAYRPGRTDVVAETIIDVASDITFGGKFFYWKFDLKSAFPSLPWKLVKSSLKDIGYPEAFIDFVMVLVMAPIVRQVKGKQIPVPNTQGCQAGLPESSILLNIVMKPIDEEITATFAKLSYKRYSDDGILVGAQRHVLVGAARRILTWARASGLTLKDVSPDHGAESLVLDIRQQPLPLLGAEIHTDGEIHIAGKKIERQTRKLAYTIEHTPEIIGDFEVIAGMSKYASGSGSRGVCIYDRQDFQKTFESFFAYAFALNEGDAFHFLDRVRQELRIDPQLLPCIDSKHLWLVALDETGRVQAGGLRNLHPTDPAYLQAWFLYTTGLKDKAQIDRGAVEGVESVSNVAGEERGDSAHWEEERARLRAGSEVLVADGEEDREVDDPLLAGEHDEAGDEVDGPEGPGAESMASLLAGMDEEEGFSEEELDSEFMSDVERFLRSAWFGPVSSADLSSGADDVEEEPAPPGPSYHRDVLIAHVVARRVARREDGVAVVGVQRFDPMGTEKSAPRTCIYEGMHEASSLIETIESLRDDALRDGYSTLLVLLDDADLPKALLQRHRAFRQPALFRRVLDLHAPHQVSVVVAGPWQPPGSLLRRIEDDCDNQRRALRERERMSSTRSAPPSPVAAA